MSDNMRALVVTRPGGPEALQVRDVARPGLRDEQDVIVEVKAAGINPADWQNRKNGAVYDLEGDDPVLPTILGIDGVGIIVEAGAAVTNVRVDDEVWYVDWGYAGNPGSYAEYRVVRGDCVTFKPAGMGFAEAAALPVVGLTAWEAVFDKGRVSSGDHVLVHGGAGGLGLSRCNISLRSERRSRQPYPARPRLDSSESSALNSSSTIERRTSRKHWSNGEARHALM